MAELNKQGGILARTNEELARAKNVDLITMPISIDGTNCGNCRYIKNKYCTHPKVNQAVNNRMCCVLWSRPSEYRQFKGRSKEFS